MMTRQMYKIDCTWRNSSYTINVILFEMVLHLVRVMPPANVVPSVLLKAYCEVEVMKMYMPLCVSESGVVQWHLSEGAALNPGDRLATLELDDPSAVTKAEVRNTSPTTWISQARCAFAQIDDVVVVMCM